jgi:hypothetical protein
VPIAGERGGKKWRIGVSVVNLGAVEGEQNGIRIERENSFPVGWMREKV